MATNKDGTWEVVDGVQRLSTLLHFSGDPKLLKLIDRKHPLELRELQKLTGLNGSGLNDIPRSVQLTFMLRPMRVTTLNDRSDLDVRYELFERLNTGGVLLHPQEIRNCVFRGILREQLKLLSHGSAFRAVVIIKKSEQTEAIYEECVLRFFSFLDRYKKFGHRVDKFLTEYTRDTNSKGLTPEQIDLFKTTMTMLSRELPNGIVRNRAATPVNLFEAIAVGTALAIKAGKQIKRGVLGRLLENAELQRFTQGGTNSKAMVTGRIDLVRNALS
jgi:hypothetical protein